MCILKNNLEIHFYIFFSVSFDLCTYIIYLYTWDHIEISWAKEVTSEKSLRKSRLEPYQMTIPNKSNT